MRSFYADLIESTSAWADCKEEPQSVSFSAPIAMSSFNTASSISDNMDVFSFQSAEDNDEELKIEEVATAEDKVSTMVKSKTPCLPDSDTPVKQISSNNCKQTKSLLNNTTFAGYELHFYDGFTAMNDIVSVDYAIADPILVLSAAGHYFDGDLAEEYPLAVRFLRTEFADTKAKKNYPLVVMTAENEYGVRACRVFLDLRRIVAAGRYSAYGLIAQQYSLYCGQVGPKGGQLHAWPTPERCGFIANGQIQASNISAACTKIVKALPELRHLMDDLQADANSAQVAGHKLSDGQLDVLAALLAEVKAE